MPPPPPRRPTPAPGPSPWPRPRPCRCCRPGGAPPHPCPPTTPPAHPHHRPDQDGRTRSATPSASPPPPTSPSPTRRSHPPTPHPTTPTDTTRATHPPTTQTPHPQPTPTRQRHPTQARGVPRHTPTSPSPPAQWNEHMFDSSPSKSSSQAPNTTRPHRPGERRARPQVLVMTRRAESMQGDGRAIEVPGSGHGSRPAGPQAVPGCHKWKSTCRCGTRVPIRPDRCRGRRRHYLSKTARRRRSTARVNGHGLLGAQWGDPTPRPALRLPDQADGLIDHTSRNRPGSGASWI